MYVFSKYVFLEPIDEIKLQIVLRSFSFCNRGFVYLRHHFYVFIANQSIQIYQLPTPETKEGEIRNSWDAYAYKTA